MVKLQVVLLVAQLLGVAAIVAGVAMVCAPAAWCVGGVAAVLVGEYLQSLAAALDREGT